MDQKGGTVLLLLVFCTVLATSEKMKADPKIQEAARQMMRKCKQKGFEPDIDQLRTAMSSEKNSDIQDNLTIKLLCWVKDVLKSVFFSQRSSKLTCPSDNMDSTRSELNAIIQRMNNLKEAPKCYSSAVVSPRAWKVLESDENMNMDSEEYDLFVKASSKMMEIPFKNLQLPKTINDKKKIESLMMELRMNYPTLKKHGPKIVKWAKEKYLNCTSSTTADSDKCDKWVTCPAFIMLGPYISSLPTDDIERSPQEELCKCFKRETFKSIMDKMSKPKPITAKKLLSKIQTCPEFLARLDSLGPLLCYYRDLPKRLTQDQSNILLNGMSQCPGQGKLRRRLLSSISKKNLPEAIKQNPRIVSVLSNKQLKMLSKTDVEAVLKNPDVTWDKKLKRKLLRIYLNGKKCAELLTKDLDLRVLGKVMDALPKCVVKKMASQVRRDPSVLETMTPGKAQAFAMVKELRKDLDATQLMKLPDRFLQAVPTKVLKTLTVKSWDDITKKPLRMGPTCYFAKKMTAEVSDWYKNPGPIVQCITCEMVRNVTAKYVLEMSLGLADASQWLSKTLAGCAADKLFETLALESINSMLLMKIPTVFLLYLPQKYIKKLPKAVCPDFLDKMKEANFSFLPVESPSRAALVDRALRCLGKDLSKMSMEDMEMLGNLVCLLTPSQLRLLPREQRRRSLQDLVDCDFNPRKEREGVTQLLIEEFREPPLWPENTAEEMAPLLCMDKNIKCSLLNKPWWKDVIQSLYPQCTLTKCLFELIISDMESEDLSIEARRRREADPNIPQNEKTEKRPEGGKTNTTNSNNSTSYTNTSTVTPTLEMIQELGQMNYRWTPQQLENMTRETFIEAVETLGNVENYSPEQLEVLRNKAIEVWGDAGSMNESVVSQLGCILQGFSSDELMMMALSRSSLEDLASCGWNSKQLSALWKGVAKHNNLTAENLESSDLVEMGRFLCGLSSSEIQKLNTTAFKDAVESINEVACSAEWFKHVKPHILDAYGDPSTWTAEDLSNLGTLVAALNATEFSSMNVLVYSHLSKESIPLIPPTNFAALSVSQLLALGPDKAAHITSEQRQAMSAEQKGALDQAIEGVREQTVIPGGNGADGATSSSVNLLLLLVLGFVLL